MKCTKIYVEGIRWWDKDWIYLALVMGHWQALENMAMNTCVP
jgi:hypothetical protein